jgi:hypothetical protein
MTQYRGTSSLIPAEALTCKIATERHRLSVEAGLTGPVYSKASSLDRHSIIALFELSDFTLLGLSARSNLLLRLLLLFFSLLPTGIGVVFLHSSSVSIGLLP